VSHLLIVELPGGNDGDILAAALDGGHNFTLLTADAAHYRSQPELGSLLARAEAVIETADFSPAAVLSLLNRKPCEAVLCLQDLRIVEAAAIAEVLGLRHLNPRTAALCRDKGAVRERLAAAGVEQTEFAQVQGSEAMLAAVKRLSLPLIIKPIDGFGSQHVFALRQPTDLAILDHLAELIAGGPGDLGLGVAACGMLLVERLVDGPIIGCDTVTVDGRHQLLGVNEKVFFSPPSFAIRGGCFTTNIGQFAAIEAHVGAILDALGFDQGAAHIEIVLTSDGPRLIELNPRLVGARIGRLISAARQRSIHTDLIALHVVGTMPEPATALRHAATRWIVAQESGVLESITVPETSDPEFVELRLLAQPGRRVAPPLDNADRLGYVMTCGGDQRSIVDLAEVLAARCLVGIEQAAELSGSYS
jgi:biotin carboxylase